MLDINKLYYHLSDNYHLFIHSFSKSQKNMLNTNYMSEYCSRYQKKTNKQTKSEQNKHILYVQ